MSIRIGRRIYTGSKFVDPPSLIDGISYYPVLCLTPSTKYGSLSPYMLRNKEGHLLENSYQSAKAYPTIPESRQFYSQFDRRVIWEHPSEVHLHKGELTPQFFTWREKLRTNPYAVRYPVGKAWRSKCIGAYHSKASRLLTYIEARYHIYLREYLESVKEATQFKELQTRLEAGQNLLIIEVDGPHQESIDHYVSKYKVDSSFITESTMLANVRNLRIMLADEKHPFGHGYCLAWALLNI